MAGWRVLLAQYDFAPVPGFIPFGVPHLPEQGMTVTFNPDNTVYRRIALIDPSGGRAPDSK